MVRVIEGWLGLVRATGQLGVLLLDAAARKPLPLRCFPRLIPVLRCGMARAGVKVLPSAFHLRG